MGEPRLPEDRWEVESLGITNESMCGVGDVEKPVGGCKLIVGGQSVKILSKIVLD